MALNCQDQEISLNHRNNDCDGGEDEIFTKSPKITKLFSNHHPHSDNLNINEIITKPVEPEKIKKSGIKVQVPSNITCHCTGKIKKHFHDIKLINCDTIAFLLLRYHYFFTYNSYF